MDSLFIAEQFASINFLFSRLERSGQDPRFDLHQHFEGQSLFFLYTGADYEALRKVFLGHCYDGRACTIEIELVVHINGQPHTFATFMFPFGNKQVIPFKHEYLGILLPTDENAHNLSNLTSWYESMLSPIFKKNHRLTVKNESLKQKKLMLKEVATQLAKKRRDEFVTLVCQNFNLDESKAFKPLCAVDQESLKALLIIFSMRPDLIGSVLEVYRHFPGIQEIIDQIQKGAQQL